jgi:lauroyl/myristoyl acyltransferase
MILYKVNVIDAQRVRLHLKFLFTDCWSKDEIELHVLKQLTLTVWNSLMLALLPSLKTEQVAQLVSIEGLHYIDEIMLRGKPILMLGCHLGPFAHPVVAVLQGLDYPVHFVGHAFPRHNTSRLYRKVYYTRVEKICKYLSVFNPLDGPQYQLLDVFRKGEVLYFLPDQYYILDPEETRSRHMVQVRLLKHTLNLETGGLRLGKRMGAEVLSVIPVMKDDGYHIFIEPMELPTRGTTPNDLTQDLQAFLNLIESRIYLQPFLWRDLRRSDLLERMGIMDGPQVP